MKLTALAVAIAVVIASPRADACDDFAIIAKPLGYTLGIAAIGGYAGGLGYFGWHDLADDDHSRDYLGGDIAFNGVFAALWGTGFVDAVKEGDGGSALVLGGLTLVHGAMLVHGIEHVQWDFHNFDSTAATWTLGALYGVQALAFLANDDGPHERGYGTAEIAVNAPLAAGAAYLAVEAMHDRSDGHALAFTAVAAMSTALTIHGVYTLAHPYHPAGLDFLPTATGDSVGLSAAGSF